MSNLNKPVSVAVEYWATQIQVRTKSDDSERLKTEKRAKFEKGIAAFKDELQSQLLNEFSHHADGIVRSVTHIMPGKYLEMACRAGWGGQADWPFITPFLCVEMTDSYVKVGSNKFNSPDEYQVLWQA